MRNIGLALRFMILNEVTKLMTHHDLNESETSWQTFWRHGKLFLNQGVFLSSWWNLLTSWHVFDLNDQLFDAMTVSVFYVMTNFMKSWCNFDVMCNFLSSWPFIKCSKLSFIVHAMHYLVNILFFIVVYRLNNCSSCKFIIVIYIPEISNFGDIKYGFGLDAAAAACQGLCFT